MTLQTIPDEMLEEITRAAVKKPMAKNPKDLWEHIKEHGNGGMIIPFADKYNRMDAAQVLNELVYQLYRDIWCQELATLRDLIIKALLHRLDATQDDIEIKLRPRPIVTEENGEEWDEHLIDLARGCPICSEGIMHPTYDSHYDENGKHCWVLACDKCGSTLTFIEASEGGEIGDKLQSAEGTG